MKQAQRNFQSCESIAPEQVIDALGALGRLDVGAARDLESTYYDTFDWRMYEAGKSLAMRDGADRPTIELVDNGSSGTVEAEEARLTTGFASDLPAGSLRGTLEKIIDVRKLMPRLAITSTVVPIALLDDEHKTVLRARVEQIVCRRPEAAATAPLGVQVVLQPVRGYEKHMSRAEQAIEALFRGAPVDSPLVVRGLRAVGLTPGDYSSKLQLDLDEAMSAGEASRYIHRNLLDTMVRNEEGTAQNIDSEFLHDFRVAIRRLRSALSQIDKTVLPADVVAEAKQEFRWVGRQTNRMRDLDVYLIAFPGYRAGLPAGYREALDPFHDHLARESRRESRKIAALIAGEGYRDIRDRWLAFATKTVATPEDGPDAMRPVKELANARIWKSYRRLIREGSAIADESPNAALHDLRITGKKLRYLLEFFQSLYPADELDGMVSALKKLQNVLGDFQDAEVQSHAIRDFAREMAESGSVPVETQMAMGMVAESILTRQHEARSAFHDRFVRFASPDVRASFERLFKS